MEQTLNNIDELLLKINNHPDYSKIFHKKFFSHLNEEALKHSVDMEIHGEIGHLNKKEFSLLKKNSLVNLKNASYFLWDNGLSLSSISFLGKKIEPEKNLSLFRTKQITFGDYFDPPHYLELYNRLENLLYKIETSKDLHPILLASKAHIEMIQIHPFLDGNGRASRLVQNYILESNGFPSAIIPKEESEFYRSLMNGVMHDRYSSKSDFFHPSTAENNFNLYIAGRVFQSIRDLDKELSNKKNYTIELNNLENKEVLYTIKKVISTSAQKVTHEGIQVSKGNLSKGRAFLTYQGSLDSNFFIKNLEKLSSKYGFEYNIKKN